MTVRRGLLAILLVIAALLSSNATTAPTNSEKHHKVTITGCLTRSPHGDYELVDEKGVHNLVYKSESVDLESHVGQSVALTGERSAMPSTDTGTARPMPHFVVWELRPGSGKCGK